LGNGTVTYSLYDSRRHAGRKVDGPSMVNQVTHGKGAMDTQVKGPECHAQSGWWLISVLTGRIGRRRYVRLEARRRAVAGWTER